MKKTLTKLIIAIDICVFLMFANYGFCGIVGDFIASVMFGLTGGLWHVLPVYGLIIFILLVFWDVQILTPGFFISTALVMTVAGFIIQMMTGIFYGNAGELFLKCGEDKNGGGLLFGAPVNYICKTAGMELGVFVTVCVMIAAFFVNVHIFTGKNFAEVIKSWVGFKKHKGSVEASHVSTPKEPHFENTKDGSRHINKTIKDHKPVSNDPANDKTREQPVNELKTSSSYKSPPLYLLVKDESHVQVNVNEHKLNGESICLTLANFGIKSEYAGFVQGSSVTRYEIRPDSKVRLDRITSLAPNLMAALRSGNLRIIAPIPGKDTVGIEMPNKERRTVHLRELLENDTFTQSKCDLPVVIGEDLTGAAVVDDLAGMPHLLVAGSTGSGKSSCLNSVILSLLFRFSPEELRLVIIDPKQVEFTPLYDLPHLLFPVLNDMTKTSRINGVLQWLINEMERRYGLFAQTLAEDIKSYNGKVQNERPVDENGAAFRTLPRIVVVLDEFADLMMYKNVNVTECVMRLGQKARAAGIHLILATQRPSAKSLPGEIKANVPGRIALTTASGVDSRIIIECNGAEKLLGNGDMLYTNGTSELVRVQGTFTSKQEVTAVAGYIKDNNAVVEYVEMSGGENATGISAGYEDNKDELYEEVSDYVSGLESVSIGNLQRRYKLGFNRAARLMDQLCDGGIVGEENGTKPREVLKKR